jgi:hypothetical protein
MQGGIVTVSIPVELPDNLPACHAIILRQAEVIVQLEARLDRFNRDLTALKRQLFGSRPSQIRAADRRRASPTSGLDLG